MSEEADLLTTGETPVRPLSHRRIRLIMAAMVLIGSILAAFLVSARFGAGIFVGGVLSFINFFWLDRSTRTIFDNAVAGIRPGMLAARYILRYVFLGAILWVFYRTNALPVVAVIAGLASFALAVVADGLLSIFRGNNSKGS